MYSIRKRKNIYLILMNKRFAIFSILSVLLMQSCIHSNLAKKSPDKAFEEVSFLEGKWISESEETTSIETWKKISENTYEGSSELTASGHVLFTENIKIVKNNETIQYIVFIKTQDPVVFNLIFASDSKLKFSNTSNDFPQSIIYEKQGDQKIIVTLKGKDENGSIKEVFIFNKQHP